MNPKEVSTVLVPQYLLTSEQKSVIQSKIDEAVTKLHVSREDAAALIYSHIIDDFFGKEVIVAKYDNGDLGDEMDSLGDEAVKSKYGHEDRKIKARHSSGKPAHKPAHKMLGILEGDEESKPKERKLQRAYSSKPEDYILLKFDSEAELFGALKMWYLSGFTNYKILSIVVNGKKKEFNTKTSGRDEKSYKLDVAFGEEMEGGEAGEEMCCEASE
jgi:hypothetical protein